MNCGEILRSGIERGAELVSLRMENTLSFDFVFHHGRDQLLRFEEVERVNTDEEEDNEDDDTSHPFLVSAS
jgi:hypothetical protein